MPSKLALRGGVRLHQLLVTRLRSSQPDWQQARGPPKRSPSPPASFPGGAGARVFPRRDVAAAPRRVLQEEDGREEAEEQESGGGRGQRDWTERDTAERYSAPPPRYSQAQTSSSSSSSSSSGPRRPLSYRETPYNRYNRDLRTSRDSWDEEPREKPYGDFDGDHLYGVSSVRSALLANKRNMTELLVQEGMDVANKKDEKSATDILDRAKLLGVPIREFSKHDLNMLSDNRPHQGFILRASPMHFRRLDSMPSSSEKFQCILALDEVWDPQNFGALLRTSHFLGVDGVVVCAKNSAPLSPTVSKASSGAMEHMEVFSTDNMMKFMDKSKENGWQVVGAALDDNSINLRDLALDKPTILILGNEGHGIRTNILRRCTHLVKISGLGDSSVVDSLNVSVTGGILLHHILGGRPPQK